MNTRFLTKQQLADRLAVTPRTIDNWCRSGFLPSPVKLGAEMQSRVRWASEAIESFEQRLRGKTAA